MPTIPRNAIVGPYSQAMGVEKANALFAQTIKELGISPAEQFTAEQGALILQHLKTKGGLVKIMAATITGRLMLQGLIKA